MDWIGESLSEALLESLGVYGALVVDRETRDEALRRLSVRRYAPLTLASVMEISVNLDAQLAVYGNFELLPAESTRGRIRIQARIANPKQMKQGEEFVEAGPLEDLAALQSHLAWRVSKAIAPGTVPTEQQFLVKHPAIRLDALENYVRGLLAPAPDQKIRLFTTAARLEPGFSQPCFQVGKLYYGRKEYRNAAEWLSKVNENDAHYRESLFLLGISRFETADAAGAVAAFQRVAAVVPLGEVFNNLGAAQLRRNDPAAVQTLLKALTTDPSDPLYHFNVGYGLWRQGQFEVAAQRFRAALERDPDDQTATMLLGRCLQKSGPRPGDPRTENLERLKRNYDESAWLHLKSMLEPQSH